MKIYRIRKEVNGDFLSSFRRKEEARVDWDWCNRQAVKPFEDQTTFEFYFGPSSNRAWETKSEDEAEVIKTFFNYFTTHVCKLEVREIKSAPF